MPLWICPLWITEPPRVLVNNQALEAFQSTGNIFEHAFEPKIYWDFCKSAPTMVGNLVSCFRSCSECY